MNYRKFLTSSNLLVIAGKSAEQNNEIIKEAKNQDLILHTTARGSPFCIIKAKKQEKIDNQSIKEAAIFCASFSKQWKQGKKLVEIHFFNKENIYKEKGMAIGTYGVRKIEKKLKVKPMLAIGLKQGKIQCSPEKALDRTYIKINQGKQSKEKAAEKIYDILKKQKIQVNKEEIMQLIPAGGFSISTY
ncbi:MAG: DUF814 domain-containing protein [Nanoarchaeota archaeon]|nr:DUF814 domain-containing protein [Nanoarchaeota archaeon]